MFDGGGLYLEISPKDSRWWRLKYRFDGKEKVLAFGLYPDVRLADARDARDDARRLLRGRIDPGEQKKAAATTTVVDAASSFEAIAREQLASRPWVPQYSKKVEEWFANDVFPHIGKLRVADLKASDFLKIARKMEARQAFETAHRVMQNFGQRFDLQEGCPLADVSKRQRFRANVPAAG
ncbi:integrase arm-type DNA-binding domain-containing protein [Stenotrophomonas sp. DR822]|uniref:tyrosine-type recombinase/integrase n=1 Tax=Stenotrophomonas sp. DR822 TaxID=2871174 RepID=UPI0021BC0E0D|nr:integrase arm-type DNA-binding domain-containing protein [Stenotrophomonas sp. DR822]